MLRGTGGECMGWGCYKQLVSWRNKALNGRGEVDQGCLYDGRGEKRKGVRVM